MTGMTISGVRGEVGENWNNQNLYKNANLSPKRSLKHIV